MKNNGLHDSAAYPIASCLTYTNNRIATGCGGDSWEAVEVYNTK